MLYLGMLVSPCYHCASVSSLELLYCNANADSDVRGHRITESIRIDEEYSYDDVSALQTTLALSSWEQGLAHRWQMGFKPQESHDKIVNLEHNVLQDHTAVLVKNTSASKVNGHMDANEATQSHKSLSEHASAIEAFESEAEQTQRVGIVQSTDMPANKSAVQTVWQTSFWGLDLKILLVELSLLLLIILIRELGLVSNWWGKSQFDNESRWHMKATEIVRIVVAGCDYSFLIPLSLNLSKALGDDAIVSGFLVSSFSGGVCIGTLCAMKWLANWSHVARRRCIVLTTTSTAVCEAILALCMASTGLRHSGALTVVLMCVRLLAGFSAGWGSAHLLMVSLVCTGEDLNNFEQWTSIADFIGLAFGPMFVAFCTSTLIPSDDFAACSAPLMVVGGLNMITAAAFSFILPLDLDLLAYLDYDESDQQDIDEFEPDILAAEPSDVLSDTKRERIVVHGFVQTGIVGLVTTGNELGTSYLMEVGYHWSPVSIALGMCTVFSIACMIIVILTLVRSHWGTAIDRRLAIPTGWLAILATVNYFPNSLWHWKDNLFLGDAIVYPSITLVSGMLMGYGFWAANPGTWINHGNVVAVAQVIDATVKFFAAPLVRWLISIAGREAYAIMQTALTIITMFNFLWVRNIHMYIDQATLFGVGAEGKPFLKRLSDRKDKLLEYFKPHSNDQDKLNSISMIGPRCLAVGLSG